MDRITFTLALVAANVPHVGDGGAILASAGGGATTAGGELGCGVETLVVTRGAHQTLDRAGSHTHGTQGDIARLGMALVASIARGLGSRAGGGGGLRVALEVTRVPVAALLALRRGAARCNRGGRNTALLAAVPVPAVSRARRARGRRRRRGLTAVGETARLSLEAEVEHQKTGCQRTLTHSQEGTITTVTAARRCSRGRRRAWSGALGGLRGSCSLHRWCRAGRSRLTLAVQVSAAPDTVLFTLGRRAARSLGSRRHTARVIGVPVPSVGGACSALGRTGRVRLAPMGKAA